MGLDRAAMEVDDGVMSAFKHLREHWKLALLCWGLAAVVVVLALWWA